MYTNNNNIMIHLCGRAFIIHNKSCIAITYIFPPLPFFGVHIRWRAVVWLGIISYIVYFIYILLLFNVHTTETGSPSSLRRNIIIIILYAHVIGTYVLYRYAYFPLYITHFCEGFFCIYLLVLQFFYTISRTYIY